MKRKLVVLSLLVLIANCMHANIATNIQRDSSMLAFAMPYILKKVNFQPNTEKITADSKETLDKLANQLQARDKTCLKVSIYLASTKEVAEAQNLALKRANVIKDYLVSKKIAANRIFTSGNISGNGQTRVEISYLMTPQGDGYGKPALFDNVKFSNISDTIFASSYPALDRLSKILSNKKNIKLKIIGHVNLVGAGEYSLDLSKKRALAVKYYLTSNGNIDPSRMVCEGYAEDYPIAPDFTDEGKSLNNRIEVCFSENEPYSPAFTLQGVSFADGTSDLNQASNEILNQAADKLIKNKSSFKITVHTDKGTDNRDNKKLSELRAEVIKKYLISKGVPEERITTEGLGDSKPITSNATPEGRAKNNRVELSVKR